MQLLTVEEIIKKMDRYRISYLSKKTGISRQLLYKYKNRTHTPRLDKIEAISKVMQEK